MEKTKRARPPRILASCRTPRPGELFYGYIRDLVIMNGIKTLRDFEKEYASPAGSSHIYLKEPCGLAILCRNIGNETFPSMKQALSMTTFYEKALRLSPGRVQALSETIIYPICKGVCAHYPEAGRKLNICQACWNEDVSQYGFGYLHVAHHLRGVKACRIHGLPLKSRVVEVRNVIFKPIKPDYWEEEVIPDQRRAVEQAEESYTVFKKGMASLKLLEEDCRECGAKYIAHPRSIQTGAGCPVCAERLDTYEWVSQRIVRVMGDNWELKKNYTSPTNGKITSKDRRYRQRRLWNILYGENYTTSFKRSGGGSSAP